MRPLPIAVAVALVGLIAFGVWMMATPTPSGVSGAKQDYDTTGGQPMRPRF